MANRGHRKKAIRDWYAIVKKKNSFIELVKEYFRAYYELMYKERMSNES